MSKAKVSFENSLVRLMIMITLIPTFFLLFIMFSEPISFYLKIIIVLIIMSVILYGAYELHRRTVFQIRTLANILEGIIAGDYSMRARDKGHKGAFYEFNRLLNGLTKTLSDQRLITIEKQVLLKKVIAQIDVAIVAIDHNNCITLINPAAEKLLNCQFEEMQGRPVKSVGLHEVVLGDYRQVVEFEIKQHKKKVFIHTDEYFEQGIKQKLIFITDIQYLLREEERQAWQRLLRVLSHEINNSLAPIASISETLSRMVNKSELNDELQEDLSGGLSVITERSMSLNSFIERYQQLAKLPYPNKSLFDIAAVIRTVSGLFEQCEMNIQAGDLIVFADEHQLQQVIVNLLKNACEAMVESDRAYIEVSWREQGEQIEILIVDQGTGINNMDNIFVPFYTTKESGSGIGLAISRQILVNHGGELILKNRHEEAGVAASIYLPINNTN